jgi:YD repeat-containing protein
MPPTGEDGIVYNRPDVLTTRIATGETEKVSHSAENSIRESKDVLGNITKEYSYKTKGKLYGKLFKTERKLAGESAFTTTWRGVYDATTGDLVSSFDALDNQTTVTNELFPGASTFQPPKKTTTTNAMGRTSTVERDLQGNIVETVGTNGVVQKMEYDSRNRLTRIKKRQQRCSDSICLRRQRPSPRALRRKQQQDHLRIHNPPRRASSHQGDVACRTHHRDDPRLQRPHGETQTPDRCGMDV